MSSGHFNTTEMQWYPDDPTYSCDICERKVDDEDDLTEVNDGKCICDDCLEEYFQCKQCGEWHQKDEASDNDDQLCVDCEEALSHDMD